jgi:ethanolamine utilization protein EutN
MNLARVVGEVVATIKHPHLEGMKLLLVQPVTPSGAPTGRVTLAVDQAQAGPGDHVLVVDERCRMTRRSTRRTLPDGAHRR